jgi:orotidine-5'-phosphate decarboxylase
MGGIFGENRRMPIADKLIVALDVNNREAALSLVTALRPKVRRFKIGLELYTACGPTLVREVQEAGGRVFLDLKLHDIPNTAARAAVEISRLGVDMFTIHLSGGLMMARRVADELQAHCQIHRLPRPSVLGVTVLTSMTQTDQEELGVTRPLVDQVLALADLATEAGLDGVVASPQEIESMRARVGPDRLIVTPGIRPEGSERDDQARTLTPRAAVVAGADFLVIGRPVIKASDPLAAAESILMQMEGA